MPKIHLNRPADYIYAPDEKVTGVITWEAGESRPKHAVKANLVWETRGKGTPDRKVVAWQEIGDQPSKAEYGFTFQIPREGPCTFSGTLISLSWHIEAASGRQVIASQPFVVSSIGKEIVLKQITPLVDTAPLIKKK